MAYKKMDEKDLEFFNSVLDVKRVLTGDQINPDYCHDEIDCVGVEEKFPDAVLRVLSTEEVSQIMKYCNDNLIPVVVRAAGTGLVGGAMPIMDCVMIDVTLMNKVLELDKDNLTLTVQPGLLYQDCVAYAADNGYLYCPDPGSKTSTVGGNVATNAGGMRAVKYGCTRESVRGITCVMPDGSVMTFGGKMVKNSSGYSFKDLLIGSEGTLAVITEIVLKVLPLPKCTISLLLPFDNIDTAMEMVPKLVTFETAPTAMEYCSRECVDNAQKYLDKGFPSNDFAACLLLTYDGKDEDTVLTEIEKVIDYAMENGVSGEPLLVDSPDRHKVTWGTRSAFLEAIQASTSMMDECDVVVPRSNIAKFLKLITATSEKFGMRLPCFGHAGDGNLHIYLCKDDMPEDKFMETAKLVFNDLYDGAKEMGGAISGEHGIGFAKVPYLKREEGQEFIDLMHKIKLAFDPNEILNPGKICY